MVDRSATQPGPVSPSRCRLATTRASVWGARRESRRLVAEYDSEFPADPVGHGPPRTALHLAVVLAGIAIVVLGADWLVRGSVSLAQLLGGPDSPSWA